jgi:hypothetical protein
MPDDNRLASFVERAVDFAISVTLPPIGDLNDGVPKKVRVPWDGPNNNRRANCQTRALHMSAPRFRGARRRKNHGACQT